MVWRSPPCCDEKPEFELTLGFRIKDVAKVVQEKYIQRAEGDLNFNLITLGAVGE